MPMSGTMQTSAIQMEVFRSTSLCTTAFLERPGEADMATAAEGIFQSLHACMVITFCRQSLQLWKGGLSKLGMLNDLFARRGWLSLVLLLAVALLSFAVLLTVSERFFCPALELISDYLKLPPVVAGATLLSFGNGAPDTFTQVAAVAQVGRDGLACQQPQLP